MLVTGAKSGVAGSVAWAWLTGRYRGYGGELPAFISTGGQADVRARRVPTSTRV